ncbi:hypothetical protein NF556_09135 [Ornithinimicrobium faecis]|uniref:Lipoprotein n=2 Tax=Ornithinimicrobium faecis TaxID=2934158 RepID=A0ABY4YYC9_9MICO|nr:hypothetical protein [Ornithinimicrobium sp. HY1793]USQ81791.1 hypothetical protein NF556_09135 [Ornithinimicrobium sp. HY1793]
MRVRARSLGGVLVALLLVACSGPDPQSAELTGPASSTPVVESEPAVTQESASSDDVDFSAIQAQGDAAVERSNQCMEERGFFITRFPNGESEIGVPPGPGGEEDLLRNWEECDELAGFPEPVVFSDDDLSRMYDMQLERGECLRANGWEPAEAPSRQTYMEHYTLLQQGGSEQPPYDPAMDLPPAEANAARDACPEMSLADM